MDLNLIPFGLTEETSEFVDIYDVERGKNCDCICPSCRTPLIARHGDSNTWHFAHAHKGVYDKTKKECEYSFFLSVRLMARQLIDSKLTLGLPEYKGQVDKFDDELGYPLQEKFVITHEQDISIEGIEVEKSFSKVPVDLVGNINGFQFVIYFTHPNRDVPSELFTPENHKCGIVSVALDSLPILFSRAKKEGKTYKEVLKKFLSSDRDSKSWVFHPNYKRQEIAALETLEKNIKKEIQLKEVRNTPFKFSDATTHSTSITPLIDETVDSYIQKKKKSKQVEFECIMCKVNWLSDSESGNVCPKCGEHLYSKQK